MIPYNDWNPEKYPPTPTASYALHSKDRSLWLWGSTGVQKSRAMSHRATQNVLKGKRVRWLSWDDMVTKVIKPEFGQVTGDIPKNANATAHVVIDDFARTNLTDAVMEGIYTYLETRRMNGRSIWVSSQYSPKQLATHISRTYKRGNAKELAEAILCRIWDVFVVWPKEK